MKNCLKITLACIVIASGCSKYVNVPTSDIGLVLTPTGFEEQIYQPGQVNVGDEGMGNKGNRLILIQQSGLQIKESFDEQKEGPGVGDHRCLTSKKMPISLDVRLVLALPDYNIPEGRKQLERLIALGTPTKVEDRVQRIDANSIYDLTARQSVRETIRDVCVSYADFDSIFAAFSDKSLTEKVNAAVAKALVASKVPLRLVDAAVSNVKPDEQLMRAIAYEQSMTKQNQNIDAQLKFLGNDSHKWQLYHYGILRELAATGSEKGGGAIVVDSERGAPGSMYKR